VIIAVAEVFAHNEEGIIEFISGYLARMQKLREPGYIVIGNIIGATSEKQLDTAIRGLPVKRTGDGLL